MRRSTLLIALAAALLFAAVPVADAAQLGSRQLRTGSHGGDVKQLQRALRKLGYSLSVDGAFGPQTDRTVRRYERAHRMKVDGIVGSREAQRILRDAAAVAAGSPPATGGQSPPPLVTPPSDGTPPPSTEQPPPSTEQQPPPTEQPPPPTEQPPPPTEQPPPSGAHVFPVLGPVDFGGAGARFGAPRSGHVHQGQDVTAPEGTPLVSVSDGTVHWRSYQAGGAGNYVVIRGADGFDYVYMHLRETAGVAPGAHVVAGQPIGHVGHTGESSGPHLHFELWAGHWQDGGHPIDPLPYLKTWLAGAAGR